MKRQELEIKIDKTGNVTILVKCVPGAECQALTADIEAELGEVIDSEKTSDYYADPPDEQEVYLAEGE